MLGYTLNCRGLSGILIMLAAVSFCMTAQAQEKHPITFSPSFKAAVNKAMLQPTSAGRTKLLIQAMQKGTDQEVFFVFPLIFKPAILKAAEHAHVCSSEISASMGNAYAFASSTPSQQRHFAEKHAGKIRADMNRLIICMDQYYSDGYLHFPHPPGH